MPIRLRLPRGFPPMKTSTAINTSPVLPPSLGTSFRRRLHKTLSVKFPATIQFSSSRRIVPVNCCQNGSTPGSENGDSLKAILSGMLDERVEQLLKKEENRDLLDGLAQASRRVEMAKRELAEIEKQEVEAKINRDYVDRLQSRAAEIAECQKEIMEAEAMMEIAAESLKGGGTDASEEIQSESINKDKERLESLKAASISAAVGVLAELPIALTRTSNSELIPPLTITFLSCLLFGVTYRYAVRRDLGNIQLKSGTSAAFGFVKGLGMLQGGGLPMELDANSISRLALDGAVYVSENVLVFLFAGVALDICMKLSILSPYLIEQPVTRI